MSPFGFVERVWIGEHHREQTCVGGRGVSSAMYGVIATHRVPVRSHTRSWCGRRTSAHTARLARRPQRTSDHESDRLRVGRTRYSAEDLAGHQRTFSEAFAEVAPEEWRDAHRKLPYPQRVLHGGTDAALSSKGGLRARLRGQRHRAGSRRPGVGRTSRRLQKGQFMDCRVRVVGDPSQNLSSTMVVELSAPMGRMCLRVRGQAGPGNPPGRSRDDVR